MERQLWNNVWLKRKTIFSSLEFFIKLLEMQWGKKSDRGNKYILLECGQSLNVYDFVLQGFIFVPFLKYLSLLTLVENMHFISSKFSEFLENKKSELRKNKYQIHQQFPTASPLKSNIQYLALKEVRLLICGGQWIPPGLIILID